MFLSADSCTTQSQVKYDKFIIEVCRIIKTLKNFQLIVKPHPSQILTEYVRNLIQEIDPDIMITEDHNNEKLFNSANLVITFNNSTTALEALILGTPVISLQTEDWANEDDIAQSNAVTCISNIPDCENKIKQILFEKDSHKTLSKNRIVFLENYLKNPGNASKSIAKILKDNTL
jgi:predicted glycosyltransferase